MNNPTKNGFPFGKPFFCRIGSFELGDEGVLDAHFFQTGFDLAVILVVHDGAQLIVGDKAVVGGAEQIEALFVAGLYPEEQDDKGEERAAGEGKRQIERAEMNDKEENASGNDKVDDIGNDRVFRCAGSDHPGLQLVHFRDHGMADPDVEQELPDKEIAPQKAAQNKSAADHDFHTGFHGGFLPFLKIFLYLSILPDKFQEYFFIRVIDCAEVDGMDRLQIAEELLPAAWRQVPGPLFPEGTEEIRLRCGKAPSYLIGGKEQAFRTSPVEEEQLQRILEKATGASMHAAAASLSRGFLSYRGIRIGVCGTASLQNGAISGFRRISSLAIRIPRACRGICDEAAARLMREGVPNTLIIGRPGDGKTTALRELIRVLSDRGLRIGVVDERNELAAMDVSGPGFDLGRCSDVLTGVDKGEGMTMLLRGMNPQILAMDEITRLSDAEAVLQAQGCGVGILASAHAAGMEELRQRPVYRQLLEQKVFSACLLIRRSGGERRYTLERLGS